jgi:hypothetical protein
MGDGQPWWLAPLAVRVAIMVTVLRWLTTLYRITPEQVQLRLGRLEREAISTYSGSGPECSCDRLSAGSAVRLGEGGYRHLETRAGQWLAERSINAADCGRSTGAVACHHLNHPSARSTCGVGGVVIASLLDRPRPRPVPYGQQRILAAAFDILTRRGRLCALRSVPTGNGHGLGTGSLS